MNRDEAMRYLVCGVTPEGRVVRGIILVEETHYDTWFAQTGDYWRVFHRPPLHGSKTYPKAAFTPEQAVNGFVQNFPLRLHPVLGVERIG